MNEFEIYCDEVCGSMPDFLNNLDEDNIANETCDRLANKFSLTQEQRCAVKIALANVTNIYAITGDTPDPVVGHAINLITRIVLKDWDGAEQLLSE